MDSLSDAYSEWMLDPADRRCGSAGGGSYAGAVRLPLGQDLHLDIQPPDFHPRCVGGGLGGGQGAGGSKQAAACRWQQCQQRQQGQHSAAMPAPFSPAPTTACRYSPALADAPAAAEDAPAASAAPAAPPPLTAPEDPDTQLILELFPEHVRAAIVEALLAAEAEEAAVAEEAEEAGLEATGSGDDSSGDVAPAAPAAVAAAAAAAAGGVQLVEVVVDAGRPVCVRLSSGRELRLEEEFSVEVREEVVRCGGCAR